MVIVVPDAGDAVPGQLADGLPEPAVVLEPQATSTTTNPGAASAVNSLLTIRTTSDLVWEVVRGAVTPG
jgi:hypothetical protein